MVRRSFRMGLRMGLLAGIGVAIVKMAKARRATQSEPSGWKASEPWTPTTSAATDEGADAATGTFTPTIVPPPVTEAEAPAAEPAAEPSAAGPIEAMADATPELVEPEAGAEPAAPSPAAPERGSESDASGAVDDTPRRRPRARPSSPPAPSTGARTRPLRARSSPPAEAERAEGAEKVAGTVAKAPKKARTAKKKEASARIWVEPAGDLCPDSHPVKAKLASRIFHVPGAFAYPRTRPDRCYRDEAAAEADGFNKAKR